jgi:hypothetical protein
MSKKIKIFKNKHKYPINLYGKHKIILNEKNIKDYLN